MDFLEPEAADDSVVLDDDDKVASSGLDASLSSDASSIYVGEAQKRFSIKEVLSKLTSAELKENEKPNARSDAWNKFNEITDKNGKHIGVARCKKCKSFLKYGGKSGTSALTRHSCSYISSTPPITGFFAKTSSLKEVSSVTKKKFTEAVALFCAKDMRPFEIVNGKGFQNLIIETMEIGSRHGILPIDKLIPDPTTIARNIATIAKNLRQQVKETILPTLSKFGGGITSDFWTDEYQKNPYLSITAHLIDDNWELKNVLIGIFEWDSSHRQTAENIYTFLLQKLDGFGLADAATLKKIVFVTDEGKNFIKALRCERRLNCTAHVLNLVLKTTLDKAGNTFPETKSLDACKNLVSFIRRSHLKAQLSKAVIPDVDTRWHSKIDMVESVLELWDEIEQLLGDRNEEHHLKDINKDHLESLLQIMRPFREAILQLETSSKYPALPLVILIYQNLLNALMPGFNDSDSICLIKEKLRDALLRKFTIDLEHKIATILHPSFRALDLQIMTQGDKWSSYRSIRELLEVDSTDVSSSRSDDYTSDISADNDQISIKRCRVAVDVFLDQFCTPTEVNPKDELDNYLAGPTSHVSFAELLNWWKTSAATYPKLSSIAKRFLAVPATSAASESIFRFAGLTVTELRNRLMPDTVSDLLFIYHNDKK